MDVDINIMGDVKIRGEVEVDLSTTIKELIYDNGKGVRNNRRIKLVQLGGPLGVLIKGNEINQPLSKYYDDMYIKSIMVFDEGMCSVDFLRFVTRFLIRELRIDTSRTRELNSLIEDIANGRGTNRTYDNLLDVIGENVSTRGERLANRVFDKTLDLYEKEVLEHINQKRCRNGICRGLIQAQCINACPAKVHIPGYVELMKRDNNLEAYRLMRQTNPLSLVCGKVCARPCEDRCRRGEIESTVGVRALQRYSAQMALDIQDFDEDRLKPNGNSVGIIGAGPGGLTAAYFLARSGYRVTIYDENNKPGGMLVYGIPSFRLPRADIEREIDSILNLGVELISNCRVGRDVDFKELELDHDAMLIATGTTVGRTLDIEGNHMSALELLRGCSNEAPPQVEGHVAIIGGGDVAIDAARTCIRLGCEDVHIVSLEQEYDMPANPEDIDEARLEGVQIHSGYGIDSMVGSNLRLKACTQVFDDDYLFSPLYDTNNTKEIKAMQLVFAIGQDPNTSFIDNIDMRDRGYIITDREHMTSREGIFSIGDVINPGIAIDAIAAGKEAADSIDSYLGGKGLYIGDEVSIPETPLNITLWDIAMVKEDKKYRGDRRNFEEVTSTLNCQEAKLEASRCMRCDRNSVRELLLRPRKQG